MISSEYSDVVVQIGDYRLCYMRMNERAAAVSLHIRSRDSFGTEYYSRIESLTDKQLANFLELYLNKTGQTNAS